MYFFLLFSWSAKEKSKIQKLLIENVQKKYGIFSLARFLESKLNILFLYLHYLKKKINTYIATKDMNTFFTFKTIKNYFRLIILSYIIACIPLNFSGAEGKRHLLIPNIIIKICFLGVRGYRKWISRTVFT